MTKLIEWLGEQELEHDYVVYQCDEVASPWTRRALRQAEHVLIVGSVPGDPSLGEIEARILSESPAADMRRRTLVLVHEDEREPTGTADWLRLRDVSAHHHVRLDAPADFERLARFLTGRAFGLTLGGGAARGLAHVGVFRALDELGIVVDAIGGASIGSVLAAQWAQGWDYEAMVRETCLAGAVTLKDFTLPSIAFTRGRKFSRMIRNFNGDRQIEDLRVRFFCVSSNLNRAQVKVHREGSLAKAVLASTRTPGVFPPIVYDGDLHVDGGVLNNVPVDVMAEFSNGGHVVGVDVSPPHELSLTSDYGDEFSGWRAFWRRHRPFTKGANIPRLLTILVRSAEFGGIAYKKSKVALADLYLCPSLLRFKRTDFHAAEQIVEIGYQFARPELEKWLERSANEGSRRSGEMTRRQLLARD